MKTINDIFEMLDLFYANIHLYKKIRKDKTNEDNRSESEHQITGGTE